MIASLDNIVADEWLASMQKEIGILQSSVMLKDILIEKLSKRLVEAELDKEHLKKELEDTKKTAEELRELTRVKRK